MGAERERVATFGKLDEGLRDASEWYWWGPYLSERQWGTVREDYSADGEAWDYFPHDHARSRTYRWGEDGLAGFCDIEHRVVGDLRNSDRVTSDTFFVGVSPALTMPELEYVADVFKRFLAR